MSRYTNPPVCPSCCAKVMSVRVVRLAFTYSTSVCCDPVVTEVTCQSTAETGATDASTVKMALAVVGTVPKVARRAGVDDLGIVRNVAGRRGDINRGRPVCQICVQPWSGRLIDGVEALNSIQPRQLDRTVIVWIAHKLEHKPVQIYERHRGVCSQSERAQRDCRYDHNGRAVDEASNFGCSHIGAIHRGTRAVGSVRPQRCGRRYTDRRKACIVCGRSQSAFHCSQLHACRVGQLEEHRDCTCRNGDAADRPVHEHICKTFACRADRNTELPERFAVGGAERRIRKNICIRRGLRDLVQLGPGSVAYRLDGAIAPRDGGIKQAADALCIQPLTHEHLGRYARTKGIPVGRCEAPRHVRHKAGYHRRCAHRNIGNCYHQTGRSHRGRCVRAQPNGC
eukprot:7386948-Prymnesium_polylepis.4